MIASPARIRLTSLLPVEERLLEAEYFVRRLPRIRLPENFGYEVNAFLSAVRSVTFVLQKEFSHVPGFIQWWDGKRAELGRDKAASFFLELRNYSQKEGRIPMVGLRISKGRGRQWSHRFAGTAERVPEVLLNRDVAGCCREHLAKIARIILEFSDAFPYHGCPTRALTPEGVQALRIDLDSVEAVLGYPPGWMAAAEPDAGRRIELLRRHVDGVDFAAIERLARLKGMDVDNDTFQERWAGSLVQRIEETWRNADAPDPITAAFAAELLGKPEQS